MLSGERCTAGGTMAERHRQVQFWSVSSAVHLCSVRRFSKDAKKQTPAFSCGFFGYQNPKSEVGVGPRTHCALCGSDRLSEPINCSDVAKQRHCSCLSC